MYLSRTKLTGTVPGTVAPNGIVPGTAPANFIRGGHQFISPVF